MPFAGMGMFCEAYFIFSIGNIKPFFSYQYPACYRRHVGCSVNLTRGPDYSQILGIICGMVALGFVGDKIGRRLPPHHASCSCNACHLFSKCRGFLVLCWTSFKAMLIAGLAVEFVATSSLLCRVLKR